MNKNFVYNIPVKVFFKNDLRYEIVQYIKMLNISRPCIITDKNIAKQDWFAEIVNAMKEQKVSYYIWDKVVCEPTDSSINQGIHDLKNTDCDGIIGIGGGSTLDSAKAINVGISNHSSNIKEFLRPNSKNIANKLPMILMPTTAGTGAEVTRGTVIIDDDALIKRGFGNGGCYADIALVDPVVGRTQEQKQILTSGLDALCHALESFIVNQKNPISKMLSFNGLTLVWNNLHKFYQNPDDSEARENMFLASLISTMAFSTGVGLTFSHHISDVIGPRYRIPHGFASVFTILNTLKLLESKNSDFSEDLNSLSAIVKSVNISDEFSTFFAGLDIPDYSEYFTPSEAEIIEIFSAIMGCSYRAISLDGEELLNILKQSFLTDSELKSLL